MFTFNNSLYASEPTPPTEVMLEGKKAKITRKKVEPTLRDVAYGPHARNNLDFWKAESTRPTPLVFYIHGWGAGSKEENAGPDLNLLYLRGRTTVSLCC